MPTKTKDLWTLAACLASVACQVPSGSAESASADGTGEETTAGETDGGGTPVITLDWVVDLDAGDALAMVCDVAVGADGTIAVAGVSVDPVDLSPLEGWVRFVDFQGNVAEPMLLREAHSPGAVAVGADGSVFVTGGFGDVDGEHGLWFARLEPDGSEAWYEAEPGDTWNQGVFNVCWGADADVAGDARYIAVYASDDAQTSFRIFDQEGVTQASAALDEAFSWPARVVVDSDQSFFVAGRASGDTWKDRHHVVEKYDFTGQLVWASEGPGSLLDVLSHGSGGVGVGLLGEPVDDGVLRIGGVGADGVEEWMGAWPHLETHQPSSDWGEAIVFMQTASHDPREERLAGMWIDGSSAWTHPLDDAIDAVSTRGMRSGADGALYLFGESSGEASWLARMSGE